VQENFSNVLSPPFFPHNKNKNFKKKKLNTKISPWQQNKKFQQQELNATISP
jgi:hypothetical protein